MERIIATRSALLDRRAQLDLAVLCALGQLGISLAGPDAGPPQIKEGPAFEHLSLSATDVHDDLTLRRGAH